MKFDDTQYTLRIEALFRRHQSVQNVGFVSSAYKPGLEAIARLDKCLGSSASRLKVIHVAGTNGKGTVCSMISALLASRGLKIGLYTSPHLLDFRERIKCVEGNSFSMISKEEVWTFLDMLDQMDGSDSYSFFEITTAMAFWWFDRQGMDCVLLECGLGGRLDSTNIVSPLLSVVTSIGLDHCAILGNTRAKIAAEKAGIFKRGVPALVASSDEETRSVFESTAKEVDCPLYFADNMSVPMIENTNTHEGITNNTQNGWAELNARTVVAALNILASECANSSLANAAKSLLSSLYSVDISSEAAYAWTHFAQITGLQARWMEKDIDGIRFIYDIGHNPPALEKNMDRLAQLSSNGSIPVTIIYGIMADKDLDSISHILPSWADYILVSPHNVRAMEVDALYERLNSLRPELKIRAMQSVAAAITWINTVTQAENLENKPASNLRGIVYVGGSTFVVSEALSL